MLLWPQPASQVSNSLAVTVHLALHRNLREETRFFLIMRNFAVQKFQKRTSPFSANSGKA
jgi:hypothetical protein